MDEEQRNPQYTEALQRMPKIGQQAEGDWARIIITGPNYSEIGMIRTTRPFLRRRLRKGRERMVKRFRIVQEEFERPIDVVDVKTGFKFKTFATTLLCVLVALAGLGGIIYGVSGLLWRK